MCKSLFDYATPIKPLPKEKLVRPKKIIIVAGRDVHLPHSKGEK